MKPSPVHRQMPVLPDKASRSRREDGSDGSLFALVLQQSNGAERRPDPVIANGAGDAAVSASTKPSGVTDRTAASTHSNKSANSANSANTDETDAPTIPGDRPIVPDPGTIAAVREEPPALSATVSPTDPAAAASQTGFSSGTTGGIHTATAPAALPVNPPDGTGAAASLPMAVLQSVPADDGRQEQQGEQVQAAGSSFAAAIVAADLADVAAADPEADSTPRTTPGPAAGQLSGRAADRASAAPDAAPTAAMAGPAGLFAAGDGQPGGNGSPDGGDSARSRASDRPSTGRIGRAAQLGGQGGFDGLQAGLAANGQQTGATSPASPVDIAGNGSAPAGTPVPLDVNRLVAAWDLQQDSVGQTLTVRLTPDVFGAMSIRLERAADGLTACIRTDSQAACALLTARRADLESLLQAKGFHCRAIDIAVRDAGAAHGAGVAAVTGQDPAFPEQAASGWQGREQGGAPGFSFGQNQARDSQAGDRQADARADRPHQPLAALARARPGERPLPAEGPRQISHGRIDWWA